MTGTAAAEGAGCPVLVVPNDVDSARGPRRRHIGRWPVSVSRICDGVFAELSSEFGERTA